MKRQIRRKVFETNSSSVHSLTICDADTFKKWKNGELLYDKMQGEFIEPVLKLSDSQKEKAKESYIKEMSSYWKQWDELSVEEKNKWYDEYGVSHGLTSEDAQSYDDYFGDYYYETYSREYTTKSGDSIVAFGYYGHD